VPPDGTRWEPVIGLEIHVQLKTRTKMFCRCENVWGAEPNTRTCPVCLAHPGTLPVLNKKAIEWTVKLGVALDCEIASHALFHRKNYFYPDLPKGYQISQYDIPLCAGGRFVVPGPDGDRVIGIVRAHLEEDAAKTIHVGGTGGRIAGAEQYPAVNAGFDGFAINYGTGGIGAEVYANRIGVGPMGGCVDCKFEEFFLSAWSVGDPAMPVMVNIHKLDPEHPQDERVDELPFGTRGGIAVRSEFPVDGTYVVMLTAKGQAYDRRQGEEAGADLYMTKPFDPDELLVRAREVLGLEAA